MSKFLNSAGIAGFVVFFSATAASAYIGPGAGLGAIGALLGVVFAVFVAVVGLVWYPVKRIMRKRKQAREAGDQKPAE